MTDSAEMKAYEKFDAEHTKLTRSKNRLIQYSVLWLIASGAIGIFLNLGLATIMLIIGAIGFFVVRAIIDKAISMASAEKKSLLDSMHT